VKFTTPCPEAACALFEILATSNNGKPIEGNIFFLMAILDSTIKTLSNYEGKYALSHTSHSPFNNTIQKTKKYQKKARKHKKSERKKTKNNTI
ncbi:hypothetical protein CF48_004947, partial [Escherichia coli]|nr:hypothetical protein [Escherichia coli]